VFSNKGDWFKFYEFIKIQPIGLAALYVKKFDIWSAEKSNTNVVREVFFSTPINQALGLAIVSET
jgi:hypothetical protein